jgi:hypothetical protein
MKPEDAALTAVGVTLGISALFVAYLNRALTRVLEDYCGKPERAQFWAGCVHILMILLPLTIQLTLADPTRLDSGSGLWLTLAQLKWGLVGQVATVVLLASTIGLVGRAATTPVWLDGEQVDDLNRLMARVRELRAREIVAKPCPAEGESD